MVFSDLAARIGGSRVPSAAAPRRRVPWIMSWNRSTEVSATNGAAARNSGDHNGGDVVGLTNLAAQAKSRLLGGRNRAVPSDGPSRLERAEDRAAGATRRRRLGQRWAASISRGHFSCTPPTRASSAANGFLPRLQPSRRRASYEGELLDGDSATDRTWHSAIAVAHGVTRRQPRRGGWPIALRGLRWRSSSGRRTGPRTCSYGVRRVATAVMAAVPSGSPIAPRTRSVSAPGLGQSCSRGEQEVFDARRGSTRTTGAR